MKDGFCLIDGICFDADARDPNNSCQVCDPDRHQTFWTLLSEGDPCNDGNACTRTDVCQTTAVECEEVYGDNGEVIRENCTPILMRGHRSGRLRDVGRVPYGGGVRPRDRRVLEPEEGRQHPVR